jgi:transcriptional regulator with XRE-family HTH domain
MTTVKDGIHPELESGSEARVGATVQALRERSGISLRALATRAGFSASFISQVEHGQASPSIASLEKIATALGVTLSEFFAHEPRPAGGATIVRAAERPQLTSGWSNAMLESLGALPSGGIEPVMMTLAPGGRSGARPAAHHGEEFALVFAGRVRLTLDETVHLLERGDAVTFSSETPHHWENLDPEPASILLVSHRPR